MYQIFNIVQQILSGNGKWMPILNKINKENTTLEVICTEYSQQELDEYLRYIDENLSNSLLEITFTGCADDPTSQWTNIFKEVGAVRLRSDGISTIGSINIHHFFPNMRVLESYAFTYANLSFIENNFPKLEKIIYSNGNREDNQTMEFFGKILPHNQQVKQLFLFDNFDRKNLQLINDLLPNLQELDFYGNSFDFWEAQTENPVRFKNVKRISLTLGKVGARTNIFFAFDQLEEISNFYDAELNEKWIDWIIQNTQLKRLSIDWLPTHYSTWSYLVKELPNLVEVTGLFWKLNDDQVTGLLKEENKLKKVTIIVNVKEGCEKLSKLSHSGWNIVDEDQCESNKFMTFVR